MRSTLIYIPYEIFGLPIVGFGWLFIACLVICAGTMGWLIRKQGWNQDTASYLPFFGVVAVVVALLLPNMVEYVEIDDVKIPLGIPFRGFGVMMMLAMIAGVGLAKYRAWQMGINPEEITSLAMWMIFPGIIGARLFFIIQYHKQFFHGTTSESLVSLFDVTKGGLVVYGSVIAGVPFGIYYLYRRGLPVLAVLDIIAPSMVVGAALGRIGCFLNGCCYGGECNWPVAVTFPPRAEWYMKDSPPYERQHELGLLYGMQIDKTDAGRAYVEQVRPGTAAAAGGVKQGDVLTHINGKEVKDFQEALVALAISGKTVELTTSTGEVRHIIQPDWPGRSLPIHPTQIYAALDAGLLAWVLWQIYPYRRRDGEIFALLITVHPITRFLLEWIRSDEPGQFNTRLTISQLISLGFVVLAAGLWYYVEKQPRGSGAAANDEFRMTNGYRMMSQNPFDLSGRVALITGAGVGIGRAISESLARAGAKIVLHCHRSQAGAAEGLAAIRKAGGDGWVLSADLSAPEEARKLVDDAIAAAGQLDILVNNAGSVVERAKIEDCSLELWQQALHVNLTSAFLVTQRAIPHLRASGNGAIVNNLSLSVQTGGANGAGAYAAAKGGLQVFTRTLARELAPAIRTNAIMPGVIETRHHEEFTTPERMAQYRKETPLGRNGTAEEVASAVLFLVSDAGKFVNGAVVDVNGGRFLR